MAKRKRPASSGNPLKQIALWQWGLFLMIWGPLASIVAGYIMRAPAVPITAADKGAAFGRGLMAVLCLIAGVVLIILHFVRRNRRP